MGSCENEFLVFRLLIDKRENIRFLKEFQLHCIENFVGDDDVVVVEAREEIVVGFLDFCDMCFGWLANHPGAGAEALEGEVGKALKRAQFAGIVNFAVSCTVLHKLDEMHAKTIACCAQRRAERGSGFAFAVAPKNLREAEMLAVHQEIRKEEAISIVVVKGKFK